MKALVLDVDPKVLEERRRRGADRWDEMWAGLLHLVPPPAERHQQIGTALLRLLGPLADARGWRISYETGLYAAADDWRVPDLMLYRPEAASERGVDGVPEVVIEIRSPGDETTEKLPWYLSRSCPEIVVVDRDSLAVEVWGQEGRVEADPDGWASAPHLGVRWRSVSGKLELDLPEELATIEM